MHGKVARIGRQRNPALRATAVAFNAAASACAAVAWEQRITNKNTLHHWVYHETRTRFGLGPNWPAVRGTKPRNPSVMYARAATTPARRFVPTAAFAMMPALTA